MNSEIGLYVPSWPVTLGGDGAGIVEAVGEDVKTYKPGDEVFGRFGPVNDKTAAFQVRFFYQQYQVFQSSDCSLL